MTNTSIKEDNPSINSSIDIKINNSPQGIINFIQDRTGKDIHEKTRKRETVEARQLCMFILRKICKGENGLELSTTIVGRLCGNKDHSTVIHAVRHVNNMIDSKDKKFLNNYSEILNHFKLQISESCQKTI